VVGEGKKCDINSKQIAFGSNSLKGRQGGRETGKNNKDARLKKVFPFLKLMFFVFLNIFILVTPTMRMYFYSYNH
jgi:hypothetical protein